MNTIDFELDLRVAVKNEYGYLGLKLGNEKNLDNLLLNYLTVHNKIIQPILRQIKISPELKSKLEKHPKKKEVILIAKRLEEGKNVNFFQSKRLLQSNFHDHLLFEWHVYHFHLSAKLEPKGRFYKKTKALLFAYIDDSQAILLDIDSHRDGVFADEKWLEILDNYFPEVLQQYIDKEIKDVHPNLTPIERQLIWSKGYTVGMTKINDKIVHSPGIGRSTSGHSLIVTKTAMEIIRWVKIINDQFSEYGKDICEYYKLDYSNAVFKVQFGNPTLDVVEQNSNKTILSFPYSLNIERK